MRKLYLVPRILENLEDSEITEIEADLETDSIVGIDMKEETATVTEEEKMEEEEEDTILTR